MIGLHYNVRILILGPRGLKRNVLILVYLQPNDKTRELLEADQGFRCIDSSEMLSVHGQ